MVGIFVLYFHFKSFFSNSQYIKGKSYICATMNRKKVFFSFVVFIICCFSVNAQLRQVLDSIKKDIQQTPSFFIALDSHNSFIAAKPAGIEGFKFGLSYNDRFKLGVGLYRLASYTKITEAIAKDTVNADLHFNYFSLFVEYVFSQPAKSHWQFSVPVYIGFGSSYLDYTNIHGEYFREKERLVIFGESALAGNYKINKWFGISFGAGLRVMLLSNHEIDKNFTEPIYQLGIKIFTDEIYSSVFSEKQL